MVQRDRVTQVGTAAPQGQVLDFKWDSDGRMRDVRLPNGTSVFSATYDVDGERITKNDPQTGAHLYSFGLHDSGGGGTVQQASF